MSEYMQIRVRVEPYYQKRLEDNFPRLANILSRLVSPPPDPAPPLIDLAEWLVQLSQDDSLDDETHEAVLEQGEKIIDLKAQVEDRIGSWRLGDAEKLLIKMEEAYQELESRLPQP